MTYKKFHFILLAGGKSTRFGKKINKTSLVFRNSTLSSFALEQIRSAGFNNITIIYNSKKQLEYLKYNKIYNLVKGGETRAQSVKKALNENNYKSNYTIIHDLARPLFNLDTIMQIIKYLQNNFECVIPYSETCDTVVFEKNSIDRKKIKLIKTPQGFVTKNIKKLHNINKNKTITDESELYRTYKKNIKIKYFKIKNSNNFKITHKEDYEKLKYFEFKDIKFGIGYDIHRLELNQKNKYINLGGVKVKSKYLIISHSDGDVILHAITDSILGALSKRDIGVYFPNNNRNKNRNSLFFLNFALNLIKNKKMFIGNIDIMVVSEKPKINLSYKQIINNLSKLMGIEVSNITLKATTNEKSGLIGEKKFIAVWSSVILKKY